MNTMDMLYSILVVAAFVTFGITLAVVCETTERHLKMQDAKSWRD
jgi:hypothetical protein